MKIKLLSIKGTLKKEIRSIQLLVNKRGDLCTAQHISIVDNKIYHTLIVAERTESHYNTLVKAVGEELAQEARGIAEVCQKGERIIYKGVK